jgi:hypothetical protein
VSCRKHAAQYCQCAGVAAIASRVNAIAAESHQFPILALKIQRDRCDLEAPANPRLLGVALAVIGLHPRRTTQESQNNDRRECAPRCQRNDLLTFMCLLPTPFFS